MNTLVRNTKELLVPSVPSQTEKLTDSQVKNSAGGYTWQVDDLMKFRRFLVLGSEGGTYYISERKLTKDHIKTILKLINEKKGPELVKIIKQYSLEGRVHKQDPLLFALAACARSDDPETKKAAYFNLNEICRIPTHLFTFIQFCETLSGDTTGWGRAHRRAVSSWYKSKTPKQLAYLVTKYQQRNGWSHKDVMRLAHVKPATEIEKIVNRYIVKGELTKETSKVFDEAELDTIAFLQAVEKVKSVKDEKELLDLIQKHRLAREHIPNNWFSSKNVWGYLLENMGTTALIRNLGKMTSVGLLDASNTDAVDRVVKQLGDLTVLQKAKIHPLSILLALTTYRQGKGVKGSLTWNPVTKIVDALDSAFYLTFKAVEPTGQRFMLALDVSGSMGWNHIPNTSLTCRDASAALAMVTAATEPTCHIMGFSNKFQELDISPKRRLDDNIKAVSNLNFGGTDCSLPMVYALKKKIKVDNFIVYTDSETYCGSTHPSQALKEYRKKMNIPHARLIVIAMESNGFTIADPEDPGMLDIPGFDSSIPRIVHQFVTDSF